jgi:D-aspartate ligase
MGTSGPPVVVLGPPRYVSPLGVMRSLRGLGARVFCLRSQQPSIAAASRWCAGQLAVGCDGRPAGMSHAAIVDQLLTAGTGLGGTPILLAASDEWALFMAEHATELRERFVFPNVPLGLVRSLTSKASLHEVARRLGLATPAVLTPTRLADVGPMADQLGYPVLLKPVVSLPGQEGVALVSRSDELQERFVAVGGLGNALLQEYIPGDDSDIWMFNGYFDANSRCLAGFTARKLRQHPPGMGVCALGVCEPNDEISELSRRLLSVVGYRGVVDIDYRLDRRDGTYKVLDVNPRLGGAFRLMVDRNGLDVARAMYLDLTSQPVPQVELKAGRKWVLEAAHLIALRHYRDRGLTLASWLRALRGLEEPATFAFRDPAPFLVSMRIVVAETLEARWQRFARRFQANLRRLFGGTPSAGKVQP